VFWREIKQVNSSKSRQVPTSIDNVEGHENISNLFAEKYESLYCSVTGSEVEKEVLLRRITDGVNTENNQVVIKSCDVRLAANKINSGKRDGTLGSYSNHFKYGPSQLYVLIASLFSSMVVHGYTPDIMCNSVIISIPKNNRASLNDSSNYRGISLTSALCKIFDMILIHKFNKQLYSSDMQYGFKPKHSTTICTANVKEVISHYMKNGSCVYACLLDASKAYDRLNLNKLFHTLLDKKLPACLVRYLYASYDKQNIKVSWNNHLSKCVYPKNGVKQGAILSCYLFNLYLDNLLESLAKCIYGCRIGSLFFGAFAYADDIILLSPTASGLQKMLEICYDFGQEFSILFNESKTQCIRFGSSAFTHPKMFLGDKELIWYDKVKYLGNWLNSKLDDSDDIVYKKGLFIQSINRLLSNFIFLPVDILYKLFVSYCSSYYGCHLWEMSSFVHGPLQITWNKCMRRIWQLPYKTHKRYLTFICGDLLLYDQIIIRVIKLLFCMLNNPNRQTAFIAKRATYFVSGPLGRNIVYVYQNFKGVFKNIGLSRAVTNSIQFYEFDRYNNSDDARVGCFIRDLCQLREFSEQDETSLNHSEVQDIIDYLCTN
jgi:hypothetical protein